MIRSRPRGRLAVLTVISLILISGCTSFGGIGFENPFDDSTESEESKERMGDISEDGKYISKYNETSQQKGLIYKTTGKNSGIGDGGVYATDYNNDGWVDLLAVGGDRPILFKNTGGSFEPSDEIPLLNDTHVKAALFFDYDNDGWEDLLFVPIGDEPIFFENKGGSFHRHNVGLDTNITWGEGASAADFNDDGCLDVFIYQYADWRTKVPTRVKNHSLAPRSDNGNPNLLFKGNCSSFKNVTADSGISGERWSLATSFADLTSDGLPDIHVANDFNYDMVYINQGNGSFKGHYLPNSNRHGMASDITDVNNDHLNDVFVTNIEYPNSTTVWDVNQGLNVSNRGNNLFINQGNGTFAGRATQYGIRVTSGWAWAGHLIDLDNDGDQDLIHTTKYYLELDPGSKDYERQIKSSKRSRKSVSSYKTKKSFPTVWERVNSTTFDSRSPEKIGLEQSNGRGMAVFDFDNDGDRDFIIADTTGHFKLYENKLDNDHNWLQVRVRTNTGTAIGSKLYVSTTNGTRFASQHSQTNFLSQDARDVHFGLGTARDVTLRVVWPSGTEYTFEKVPINTKISAYPNGTIRRANTE